VPAFFVGNDSPLEKGDKGGCMAEMREEGRETTPSAPFIKGEFLGKFMWNIISGRTYK
jgi:hypothetical protein